LRRYVTILRDKSHAKLLAEKVETQAQYELCQELGFEFYQGYYFSKPNTITGTHIPASRLSTLHLIARIQDANVGMDELEDIIAMDAGLTYKLLKIVNSAAFSLNRQVDSIKSALIILGITHVKNWASMLALSKIEDKPHELLITALVRANMSYEIARQIRVDNPDSYFTAGMLSILDALIDKPMKEIVPHLPLSAELQLALLERKGPMGEILQCITNYEKGAWDKVQSCSNHLGLGSINIAYLKAVKTTEEVDISISHAA
ncbi:MAG: HDOD domain-containing protein, partial [Gammaproteobacteria bacterium]|nr:HDOD domain-containing protein [Gammaproteobacteria bacterium]